MNPFDKGAVVVLGPDEGESFWQPLPSTGYIVNKLTPYNTPYDSFSLGVNVWGTKHVRLTLNYIANVIGGDAPALNGNFYYVRKPPLENELLFRFGIGI